MVKVSGCNLVINPQLPGRHRLRWQMTARAGNITVMKYLKNIKSFSREYTLPLIVTSVFVLLIAVLLLDRQSQLSGLPSTLLESSTPEQSNTRLISKDEAVRIQARGNTLLTPPESSSSAPPSSSASQPGGQPPANGGRDPAFAAGVSSIRYVGSSAQSGANPGTCSRNHEFEAVVRADHGPGEIKYHWERSDGDTSPTETLRAGSGRNHYSITHNWTLTTFIAERYDGWARLVVTRPSGSVSQRAEFTHSCVGN